MGLSLWGLYGYIFGKAIMGGFGLGQLI